jgi:hypothetical protein
MPWGQCGYAQRRSRDRNVVRSRRAPGRREAALDLRRATREHQAQDLVWAGQPDRTVGGAGQNVRGPPTRHRERQPPGGRRRARAGCRADRCAADGSRRGCRWSGGGRAAGCARRAAGAPGRGRKARLEAYLTVFRTPGSRNLPRHQPSRINTTARRSHWQQAVGAHLSAYGVPVTRAAQRTNARRSSACAHCLTRERPWPAAYLTGTCSPFWLSGTATLQPCRPGLTPNGLSHNPLARDLGERYCAQPQ